MSKLTASQACLLLLDEGCCFDPITLQDPTKSDFVHVCPTCGHPDSDSVVTDVEDLYAELDGDTSILADDLHLSFLALDGTEVMGTLTDMLVSRLGYHVCFED